MQFAGLEKSWILEKIAEVMEESWNYIFWSKDLVLFENWKIVLVVEQKYAPKSLGFHHFLVMEKSSNFIGMPNFCVNPE